MIVADPSQMAITVPSDETVAIDGEDEVHLTVLSVASSGSTVAIRVVVSPSSKVSVFVFKLIEDTAIAPLETVT